MNANIEHTPEAIAEAPRASCECPDDTRGSHPADPAPVTPERRQALAERIQSAIETEMSIIESSIALLKPTEMPEVERAMRTMALVTHALSEVAALNQPQAEAMPNDDSDDDPVPLDIDELRDEIAQRIEALVEVRSG